MRPAERMRPGRRAGFLLLALAVIALPAAACDGRAEGDAPGTRSEPGAGDAAPQEAGGEAGAPRETPRTGVAWVIFGADTVVAEVAATAEEREEGLMYREVLAPDAGMLFVFEEEATRSFWMKNTYIPLDIGYMDSDGVLVDIKPMEPQDESYVVSDDAAQFALEVNQGWFEDHGVEEGDTAEIVFGTR